MRVGMRMREMESECEDERECQCEISHRALSDRGVGARQLCRRIVDDGVSDGCGLGCDAVEEAEEQRDGNHTCKPHHQSSGRQLESRLHVASHLDLCGYAYRR